MNTKDMMSSIENLINNFTFIEIMLLSIIGFVFIVGVLVNLYLCLKYKKMVKELSQTNFEGMEIYKTKILNKIVSSYKETCQKSKDFINTQAIIESKFYSNNLSYVAAEKFVSAANGIMISLGCAGALYGTISMITEIATVFKDAAGADIQDILSVYGIGSAIISLIGFAFMSVFVSAVAVFLFSLLTSLSNVKLSRLSFFARLEDYLDNELGATMTLAKQIDTLNPSGNNVGDSNILYMLENTSHSMMTSTSKLESTIEKLNESLLEILGNSAKKKEVLENSKKISEASKMNLDESKKILDKQLGGDIKRNNLYVDPVDNPQNISRDTNSLMQNNSTNQTMTLGANLFSNLNPNVNSNLDANLNSKMDLNNMNNDKNN